MTIVGFAFVVAVAAQAPDTTTTTPAPAEQPNAEGVTTEAPKNEPLKEQPKTEEKRKRQEAQERKVLESDPNAGCEDKKEEKPLNIAGITSIVGSATTVAGALTGIIVGLVQVPAPWDYYKHAEQLQKSEAAFLQDPQRKHIEDAALARQEMSKIEKAFENQAGVLISSGAAVLTGGVGLVASIVDIMGE